LRKRREVELKNLGRKGCERVLGMSDGRKEGRDWRRGVRRRKRGVGFIAGAIVDGNRVV
jgi:hypothetical protein